MVLESIVDAEDAPEEGEEQLLASSPEMSAEEAVSTPAPADLQTENETTES